MKRELNAGDIQRALIRYVSWWQNIVVPEFAVEGDDRADLIQITKAGYVTEYEIKVSAADWRADLAKPKWKLWPGDGFISRFFYVVPGKVVGDRREAAIKPPDNLPFGVGVILVMPAREGGASCVERQAARRFKVPPLPDAARKRAFEVFYYRYWRHVTDVSVAALRQEIAEARKTCRPCGHRVTCKVCEEVRRYQAERKAAA